MDYAFLVSWSDKTIKMDRALCYCVTHNSSLHSLEKVEWMWKDSRMIF